MIGDERHGWSKVKSLSPRAITSAFDPKQTFSIQCGEHHPDWLQYITVTCCPLARAALSRVHWSRSVTAIVANWSESDREAVHDQLDRIVKSGAFQLDYYVGFAPTVGKWSFNFAVTYNSYPGAFDPGGDFSYVEI